MAVISHMKPATTEMFRDNCSAQNSGKRYTLYDTMLLAASSVIFWVGVHFRCPRELRYFWNWAVNTIAVPHAFAIRRNCQEARSGTLLGASGRCHERNKDKCDCTWLSRVNLCVMTSHDGVECCHPARLKGSGRVFVRRREGEWERESERVTVHQARGGGGGRKSICYKFPRLRPLVLLVVGKAVLRWTVGRRTFRMVTDWIIASSWQANDGNRLTFPWRARVCVCVCTVALLLIWVVTWYVQLDS